MLLHDPSPRLRDQLVMILSAASPLSVEDLQREARKGSAGYSKQALYKELAMLEAGGIVMKAKGQYRLTLTWVFDCLAHADVLLEQIGRGMFGDDLIPPERKSYSWQFSDVRKADRLWLQLVVSLLQSASHKTLYQSLPHPWHALLHQGVERQFENVLRRAKATSCCVVGGDTYLDRLFIERFPQDSHVANAPGLFGGKGSVSLTIVEQYIVTSSYPLRFTKAVDAYFHRVRSQRDLRAGEIVALFENPGKVTTRIEHNPRKSLRLRRKFQRYFGLPLSRE